MQSEDAVCEQHGEPCQLLPVAAVGKPQDACAQQQQIGAKPREILFACAQKKRRGETSQHGDHRNGKRNQSVGQDAGRHRDEHHDGAADHGRCQMVHVDHGVAAEIEHAQADADQSLTEAPIVFAKLAMEACYQQRGAA